MPVLVGEADHLVLQRRAIAWPDAFDPSAIERRLVEIGANDLVRGRGRVGNRAGQLFHVEHSVPPFVQGKNIVGLFAKRLDDIAKRLRRLIAQLQL